jgi:hypothetical protein
VSHAILRPLLACLTAAGLLGLFADAAPGRAAGATITALTISGTTTRPVFIVTGRGLSVPPKNPRASPSNQTLCPVKINGKAGFDYGTQFSLIVWGAQPADTDTELYSAGRYRPALNELDCIGIIVLTHTPKRITFTFGAGYVQLYRAKPRLIKNGDVVEVTLEGATFATVVRFH